MNLFGPVFQFRKAFRKVTIPPVPAFEKQFIKVLWIFFILLAAIVVIFIQALLALITISAIHFVGGNSEKSV